MIYICKRTQHPHNSYLHKRIYGIYDRYPYGIYYLQIHKNKSVHTIVVSSGSVYPKDGTVCKTKKSPPFVFLLNNISIDI